MKAWAFNGKEYVKLVECVHCQSYVPNMENHMDLVHRNWREDFKVIILFGKNI